MPGAAMKEMDCIAFLQWALPKLGFKWAGYRKVRRQVCKRVHRRIRELGLDGYGSYRAHLETQADEWGRLDKLCRITISRFFRDCGVFEALASEVLPELARITQDEGRPLRAWSIGSASGEEAYSLIILWHLGLATKWPGVALEMVGTDTDPVMLERAAAARYSRGSLKDLPEGWCEKAFKHKDGKWCLKSKFKTGVAWLKQDIRQEAPDGPFDLVFCRNLAFTYFDDTQQRDTLARISRVLRSGGALALGAHEALLNNVPGFAPWPGARHIWLRVPLP